MLCHAIDTCIFWHSIQMQCLYNMLTILVGSQEFMFLIVFITHFCLHNTRSLKNLGSVLLCTINAIQLFFPLKMIFPFGFQYCFIIYINFNFNLKYIKHYIQLVGKVKEHYNAYFFTLKKLINRLQNFWQLHIFWNILYYPWHNNNKIIKIFEFFLKI
jgi:hypothetical protein